MKDNEDEGVQSTLQTNADTLQIVGINKKLEQQDTRSVKGTTRQSQTTEVIEIFKYNEQEQIDEKSIGA